MRIHSPGPEPPMPVPVYFGLTCCWGPAYCSFRPYYQHLLFQFPSVWPTASTINPSSLTMWLLWRKEALKRCSREKREGGGGWRGGGRVTPPSLVPWLVMAGPLSTLHYASALRQMEWSRIQLRKNKQVGSVRLIVSITARAKPYCNCNVIWKTYFLCLSMKESTAHSRHEDRKKQQRVCNDRRLKAELTLAKYRR